MPQPIHDTAPNHPLQHPVSGSLLTGSRAGERYPGSPALPHMQSTGTVERAQDVDQVFRYPRDMAYGFRRHTVRGFPTRFRIPALSKTAELDLSGGDLRDGLCGRIMLRVVCCGRLILLLQSICRTDTILRTISYRIPMTCIKQT